MTNANRPFDEFTRRLGLLVAKHPDLMATTLCNIFTMRLIGNKTHGDLAEIAIAEFINKYMYDFSSVHVGKDRFRAKKKEEDIEITNKVTKQTLLVSIKAYGNGPLQLSTDKSASMFSRLEEENSDSITDSQAIAKILSDDAFSRIGNMNVLPLIYDETQMKCNILIFNFGTVSKNTTTIKKVTDGKGRIHPIFSFFDSNGDYICEVRYGGPAANALQRGLWTHTKRAINHFTSLTNGWVDYTQNEILVKLFSHALVASSQGHASALDKITADIARIIKEAKI